MYSKRQAQVRRRQCLPSRFSHKFFISCSLLCLIYPVAVSLVAGYDIVELEFGQQNRVVSLPGLSQINCTPRLTIYGNFNWFRPLAGKSRRVRGSIKTISQRLCYAFTFVMFIIFLWMNFRLFLELNKLHEELLPTIIMIAGLILLQFSTIPVRNRSACRRRFMIPLIFSEKKVFQSFDYETSCILRQVLLVSGDVELNPGPNGEHNLCTNGFFNPTGLPVPQVPVLITQASQIASEIERVFEAEPEPNWNNQAGFQSGVGFETLNRFYLLANQLYRAGGECSWCLLCGKKKTRTVGSHIFPKSLLEVYRKVHCDSETECVFDPSTRKLMGTTLLTLPLFCDTCENEASCKERKLRDLYLTILVKGHLDIKIEDGKWLKNILAVLMFRGCLTGINFTEMQDNFSNEVMRWLLALRMFIINDDNASKQVSDKQVSEKLALCLLPNGPFNPTNIESCYIFDFILRCPSFTSVVRFKDQTFFYTQFDCFHCVLPFNTNDTPGNCFSSDEADLTLPSSEARKLLFPDMLLEINFWKILELEMYFLRNPNVRSNCRIITSRFPTSSLYVPTMPLIKWPPAGTVEPQLEENTTFVLKDINKKEYIKAAQHLSPFLSNEYTIKELQKEKLAENQKAKDLQSTNSKLHNEIKKLRGELFKKEEKKKEVSLKTSEESPLLQNAGTV